MINLEDYNKFIVFSNYSNEDSLVELEFYYNSVYNPKVEYIRLVKEDIIIENREDIIPDKDLAISSEELYRIKYIIDNINKYVGLKSIPKSKYCYNLRLRGPKPEVCLFYSEHLGEFITLDTLDNNSLAYTCSSLYTKNYNDICKYTINRFDSYILVDLVFNDNKHKAFKFIIKYDVMPGGISCDPSLDSASNELIDSLASSNIFSNKYK